MTDVQKFKVWYAKRLFTFMGDNAPKNLGDLLSNWREVAEIYAESRDLAWVQMQSDMWSPNGEARDHIQELGLTHTSMSPGDILEDSEGNYWICLIIDWKRVEL